MKRRCNNPHDKVYERYGGRGITYAPEWEKFDNFYEWAMKSGYVPDQPRGCFTLDRIDNDGNYSPDNCRWISQYEQVNNTSYNVFLEYNGERHTIAEWSRIKGIAAGTIWLRIHHYNYSVKEALEEPIRFRNTRFIEYNGETKSVKEWAEQLGISKSTLSTRLLRGWSIEDAVTRHNSKKKEGIP